MRVRKIRGMHDVIDAFQRNADGSWTCITPVSLSGPHGLIQIAPGNRFSRGTFVMGVELARLLDEHARSRNWHEY